MFHIVDLQNNHQRVKGGFTTAAKAYEWGKKNLGKDAVRPWGIMSLSSEKIREFNRRRYYIRMD